MRINKIDYYLNIAEAVAKRGTCLRRNYGAVIVNNDEIVSTGYTGAPRGSGNCTDLGTCERKLLNIPSGQQYEKCRSVHAEMNACISAARKDMIGATLYLCGLEEGKVIDAEPCMLCKKIILNSGIETVVARQSDGNFFIKTVTDWKSLDFIGA